MPAKQICVQMDNEPGTLHQVTEVLKLEGVNIRAISVLDPGDDAVVRMIVDDPELAARMGRRSREIAEEKEAVEQYGSSDSGASLGDILGAALKGDE